MNTPATGDTTPAAKRLKMSTTAAAKLITPPQATRADDLARALAYIRDEAEAAAAAASDAANEEMMDDDDADAKPEAPDEPQPVPLQRSHESLPPAFTSFSATISKKVASLLMTKRAKLRVVSKLKLRETIPNSIRFNFELTGSKEVTGNSDFYDLTSACGMAIIACQTELKTYMIRAAEMELKIIDKKYRAVFHQALKGFAQLQLINRGVRPQQPSEALIRELAFSTLEKNQNYFTKEHNFNFTYETLFPDYKEANDDNMPTWNVGSARPCFLAEYAADIDTITCLLHETVIKRWLEKVLVMQAKEKAALLQTTQQSFFKTTVTKETAEGLATEKSMDETQMNSVISDKIATETKNVRAQLAKLENMIRRTTISSTDEPKNSKGGAKCTDRASVKKTNAPKPTKKQPKLSNGRRDPVVAAASANASSTKSKNKNTRKKQEKKPGKSGKNNVSFKN
jgi:hypothetical protein